MAVSRYNLRGVSASKEDVHNAIKKIDKGIFPNAFCKIVPDHLGESKNHCVIMHADGAGTKYDELHAHRSVSNVQTPIKKAQHEQRSDQEKTQIIEERRLFSLKLVPDELAYPGDHENRERNLPNHFLRQRR